MFLCLPFLFVHALCVCVVFFLVVLLSRACVFVVVCLFKNNAHTPQTTNSVVLCVFVVLVCFRVCCCLFLF